MSKACLKKINKTVTVDQLHSQMNLFSVCQQQDLHLSFVLTFIPQFGYGILEEGNCLKIIIITPFFLNISNEDVSIRQKDNFIKNIVNQQYNWFVFKQIQRVIIALCLFSPVVVFQ